MTTVGNVVSFVIDTNMFSLLVKGDERVAELLCQAELVAVPIVVIAELRAGFLHGKKRKFGLVLDDFLAVPSTITLHITDETVPIYAELYAHARAKARQLSNNDLWIAALCIQYNYPLLTFDKDFDTLPQVRRVRVE
jgi:tRNA(fMet)-specific endonuclease VapC